MSLQVLRDDCCERRGTVPEAAIPFFQFSHPPLHVPWVAMASVGEMRTFLDGLRGRVYRLNSRERFDPTGFSGTGKDAVEKIRRACVFPVRADHRAR